MKKFFLIYAIIFVSILFIVSTYNSIIFEFSDILQIQNLLIAFVSTICLSGVHLSFYLLKLAFKHLVEASKSHCSCKLIIGINNNTVHNVSLNIFENVLKVLTSSNKTLKVISFKDIKNIGIVTDEILDEKEKSVLARALVGGLVFGVAGAVVGGMSGMGTKKEYKLVKLIKIETNNETYFALPDGLSDSGVFVRNCRNRVYKYRAEENS